MKNLFSIILLLSIVVLFDSCKKKASPTPAAAPTTPSVPNPTETGDSVFFSLWLYVPVGSGGTANTTITPLYTTSNVRALLNNVPVTLSPHIYQGVTRNDRFDNFTNGIVMRTGDSLVFEIDMLFAIGSNGQSSGYINVASTIANAQYNSGGSGNLGYKEARNDLSIPYTTWQNRWLGNAYVSNGQIGSGVITDWEEGYGFRYVYKHP